MGGSGSKLKSCRVVVIGGGYGGVAVAMALKDKCQLTMIDPKDHFFHNIGALRACVEPGFTEKIFIPYAPSLGNSFLQGRAKRIDFKEKKVILDGGKNLPYDYLVLATGSSGPFPGKLNRMAPVTEIGLATEMYKLTLEKIKSANKIVIIGGGAVGVELAGEIATEFPGKNLTLIHSNKKGLVNGKRFTDKFRKNILDQLKKLKVNVLIGERVMNMDELPKDGFGKCKVKTDARKQLDADLIFNCTGLKTNSDVYTDQLDDKMDDDDCLRVNNYLQVEGHTDVYAVGDCCNADKVKMAYTAGLHAEQVVTNIQVGAAGKNYHSYKPGGPQMVVSIGRNGGVAQKGSSILGSLVVKKLKSNELFVSKYWKQMKQIAPGTRRMTIKQPARTASPPGQQPGAPASHQASTGGNAVKQTPSNKQATSSGVQQKTGAKNVPPGGKKQQTTQKKQTIPTGAKQTAKQKSKKK